MVIAVGSLSLMDGCMKLLSPHYPALQIASMRGLSALPFIILWIGFSGGYTSLLRIRFPLHVLRAVIGIMMLSFFAFAIRRLPLTEAYSIFFIAPLLITALAVLILKETVDWTRWLAIAIGFCGVLIVLRPSGTHTLTIPGLAVVATAVGYAFSAIIVRVLGKTDSTQSMMFWLMLMVGIGAGLLAIPSWRPIQSIHWPIIAGMALSGSLGQLAITEAFKLGEASFIAPFEYTALAWGVGLDWFVWRTSPAAITMLGAFVIIASGVYLVRREKVHVEAEHP